MTIQHATHKSPGNKLFAESDWNAEHTGSGPQNWQLGERDIFIFDAETTLHTVQTAFEVISRSKAPIGITQKNTIESAGLEAPDYILSAFGSVIYGNASDVADTTITGAVFVCSTSIGEGNPNQTSARIVGSLADLEHDGTGDVIGIQGVVAHHGNAGGSDQEVIGVKAEVKIDNLDVGNFYGVRIKLTKEATTTHDSAGISIKTETAGGTPQTVDAVLKVDTVETTPTGFNYGIDFKGADIGTEIRFKGDKVLYETPSGYVQIVQEPTALRIAGFGLSPANTPEWAGAIGAGQRLIIKATHADNEPYIEFIGGSSLHHYVGTGAGHYFNVAGSTDFYIEANRVDFNGSMWYSPSYTLASSVSNLSAVVRVVLAGATYYIPAYSSFT